MVARGSLPRPLESSGLERRCGVEYGIRLTNSEAGPWFGYRPGRIQVSIAPEPGTDEMASARVEVATGAELEKAPLARRTHAELASARPRKQLTSSSGNAVATTT